MKKSIIFLILLLTLLIEGCTISNDSITTTTVPTESNVPTSTLVTVDFVIPTTDNQTGVIYGTLNYHDGSQIDEGIFLAHNLSYENPELPSTISFSYQNSPRGKIDPENGNFYFENISPAENYVIAIMINPSDSIIVKEENSDYPLLISIKPGESLNLGSITVDKP